MTRALRALIPLTLLATWMAARPAQSLPLPLQPRIETLEPDQVTAGAPDTSVSVTGSGFAGDDTGLRSRLYVEGDPLETDIADGSHLSATIPSRYLSSPGSLDVYVANGIAAGGLFQPLLFSNMETITVSPKPPVGISVRTFGDQAVRRCFYVGVVPVDEDGNSKWVGGLSYTLTSDDVSTAEPHDGGLTFYSDYCLTEITGPVPGGSGGQVYVFARATRPHDVAVEAVAGDLSGVSVPIHIAGGLLSGTVLRDAGGAAAGTQVYVAQTLGGVFAKGTAGEACFQFPFLYGRYSFPSTPSFDGPVATVEPDGTFRSVPVAPGSYRVFFGAPPDLASEWIGDAAHADASATIDITDAAETSGVAASLASGGTISGLASAVDGSPIPDAGVMLEDPSTGSVFAWKQTGSDGRFRTYGMRPGSYAVHFVPDRNRYVPAYYGDAYVLDGATPVPVSAGSDRPGADAVLATGASMSVSARAADDGATLDGFFTVHDVATGTQRAHGLSIFGRTMETSPGLPTGDYRIRVHPLNSEYLSGWHGGDRFAEATIVNLARNERRSVDVTAERGASFSATVLGPNMPVGPIRLPGSAGDADIEAYDADTGELTACGYGDSGMVRTAGLRAGRYKLRIDPPGTAASTWYPNAPDRASAEVLTIGRGEQRSLGMVVVGRGAVIRGRITDPDGAPASGLQVRAFVDSEQTIDEYAYTSSNGSYAVTGLAPGSYRIRATAFWGLTDVVTSWYPDAPSRSQATPVVVNAGQELTADFALGRASRISGSVSGSSGPATTTYVEFLDPSTREWLGYAFAKGDGSYTSIPLHAGAYVVRFSSPDRTNQYFGGSQTASGATPVTAVAGQTTTDIDVLLRAGRAITGKVTAAHSAARMPSVRIALIDAATGERVGTSGTNEHGLFRTGSLDPGVYDVAFEPNDGIFAPHSYAGVLVGPAADTNGIDAALGFS